MDIISDKSVAPESTPVLRAVLAVFLLAMLVRCGILFVTSYYKSDPLDNYELHRIADNLARTGQFANPYICTTGPTAHVAPGYPFFQAIIFRIWKPGYNRELVRSLLGCLISALTYGLLPWLAGCLRLPLRTGVVAGLLGSMIPLFTWIEVRGLFDGPWVALFLVLALGLSARAFTHRSSAAAVTCGLVWGIGFLFSPVLLPIFLALLVSFLISQHVTKQSLLRAGAVGALAGAVVLPWTIRNHQQLGHWFWIRDNFGLELHLSNSETAVPIENENIFTASFQVHPCSLRPACAEVQRVGEYRYCQNQKAAFLEFVRSDPRKFMRLTSMHFWYFWVLPLNTPIKSAAALLLTLGCLGGMALLLWRNRFAALLLGAVLVLFSLPYYLIQYDARYPYPIRPTMLLPAGYLVCFMYSKLVSARRHAGLTHT